MVGLPDEERATTASPNLEPGCVVACFRVNTEGRKPLRSAQLDLDLPPARIVSLVAWVVSQNILVAQLLADLRSDVGQVVQILYGEGASTGQFGHFAQQ